MKELTGDIWTWHSEGRWIVVTTNIGWKKDGTNPMGAGTAKQAAELYPDLPAWYGKKCEKFGADTAVLPYDAGRLILFPTKPLDEECPWLSWRGNACLDLIRRSIIQLKALVPILEERKRLIGQVGVPLVGCKNGNLRPKEVLPLLRSALDDRFILFEKT